MALTADQQAGFALAALLANDRSLSEVEDTLDPSTLAALRARLAPDEPRARQLARLLECVRPPLLSLAGLSPRMVALLAPRLPRTLARAYAAHAGAARPGFSPPADLFALLLRIARALEPRRER